MRLIHLLVVAPIAASSPAFAGQATCSNPGLPVGASVSTELAPGQLVVGLTEGILPISSSEVLAEPTGALQYDNHLVLLDAMAAATGQRRYRRSA